MAGEKNLDALIGRTEYAIKNGGTNLAIEIDGASTTVIRDGEITQNGLELYAYLEHEVKKASAALEALKKGLIDAVKASGTPVDKPKTKGTKVYEGPRVQDGRRVPILSVSEVENFGWAGIAQQLAGKDEGALKAHARAEYPDLVTKSERNKLDVK